MPRRDRVRSSTQQVRAYKGELVQLHSREASGEQVSHQIKDVQTQLEVEHLHRAEGAHIRAREQWAEEVKPCLPIFCDRRRPVHVVACLLG